MSGRMIKEIKIGKYITRKTFKEEAISEWFTLKGYTLITCALQNSLFAKAILNVVFGEYEEFKRYIKDTHKYDLGHEDCVAMYVWVFDKERNKHYKYLLIQEVDWTAKCYGTMCHELHHYTHIYLKELGIEYSEGSEEVFAYFQGHFMELLIKAFIELKKALLKKKKK